MTNDTRLFLFSPFSVQRTLIKPPEWPKCVPVFLPRTYQPRHPHLEPRKFKYPSLYHPTITSTRPTPLIATVNLFDSGSKKQLDVSLSWSASRNHNFGATINGGDCYHIKIKALYANDAETILVAITACLLTSAIWRRSFQILLIILRFIKYHILSPFYVLLYYHL